MIAVTFGTALREDLPAPSQSVARGILRQADSSCETNEESREEQNTTTAQAAVTSYSPLHLSFDADSAKCDA